MAVVCAATVVGCGSASTGQVSAEAVINSVQSSAGPNADVRRTQVLVEGAAHGSRRWMPMVVACTPDGGCEVIAPDGARYPDLQAFVDDSTLLKAGDEVLGPADITSPGEPVRLETFTRRTALSWGDVGGGALLVLVSVGAAWLAIRTRRRRRADE